MAEMKDCIGKNIKVGKTSITIKGDNGKTCGVVRDIQTLANMQLNMEIEYARLFKKWGLCDNRAFKRNWIIVKDGKIYALRNIKTDQNYIKYGYFSEYEKQGAEEREKVYATLKAHGVEIIECVLL